MSEFFKALGLSVLYINLIFIIWAKINELTEKTKDITFFKLREEQVDDN